MWFGKSQLLVSASVVKKQKQEMEDQRRNAKVRARSDEIDFEESGGEEGDADPDD